MKKSILWITETAVMLALLVALQALTKPLGQQLITGSLVNMVLAVTVLVAGYSSGITVAVISPILAYLLGIAPQVLTVPAIMLGNVVYVTVLYLVAGRRGVFRRIVAWLAASVAKFAVLYAAVAWVICGLLAKPLLNAGLLKAPMLKLLPATFGTLQLFTALIGGALALAIVPVLRKALHK